MSAISENHGSFILRKFLDSWTRESHKVPLINDYHVHDIRGTLKGYFGRLLYEQTR